MTLDGSQLAKSLVEFIREGALVDVLVVDTDSVDDLRSLGLSNEWFVLPKYVAQPLGALIDLYSKVIRDNYGVLEDEDGDTPENLITDRLYKIVADEDLLIETGVESGVQSILLSYNRMDTFRIVFKGIDDFYDAMDGVVQTFNGERYMLKLRLLYLGSIYKLTTKQQIDYIALINKYLGNNDFAFNLNYERDGDVNRCGVYTTKYGNTGYLGVKIMSAEHLEAALTLQIPTDDFITHVLDSTGIDISKLQVDGASLS